MRLRILLERAPHLKPHLTFLPLAEILIQWHPTPQLTLNYQPKRLIPAATRCSQVNQLDFKPREQNQRSLRCLATARFKELRTKERLL